MYELGLIWLCRLDPVSIQEVIFDIRILYEYSWDRLMEPDNLQNKFNTYIYINRVSITRRSSSAELSTRSAFITLINKKKKVLQ